MCCLLTMFALLGPRGSIVLWWLIQPGRWGAAFDTFIVPFLGFLFAPWTTLAYVAVAAGGVDGADWILVGLAVALDVFSWVGGAYGNRDRISNAYGTPRTRPLE
jgi:hypothetical protein